jgi:hypothetical protein
MHFIDADGMLTRIVNAYKEFYLERFYINKHHRKRYNTINTKPHDVNASLKTTHPPVKSRQR